MTPRPLSPVWQRLWHCFAGVERDAFLEGARFFARFQPAIFSWGLVTGVAMSKSALTVPEATTVTPVVWVRARQGPNLADLVSPYLNGAIQGVIIVLAVVLQREKRAAE